MYRYCDPNTIQCPQRQFEKEYDAFIYIERAENLKQVGIIAKNDTFVKFKTYRDEREKKTYIVNNSMDPLWNCGFRSRVCENEDIMFELCDVDLLKKVSFVGKANVRVSDLSENMWKVQGLKINTKGTLFIAMKKAKIVSQRYNNMKNGVPPQQMYQQPMNNVPPVQYQQQVPQQPYSPQQIPQQYPQVPPQQYPPVQYQQQPPYSPQQVPQQYQQMQQIPQQNPPQQMTYDMGNNEYHNYNQPPIDNQVNKRPPPLPPKNRPQEPIQPSEPQYQYPPQQYPQVHQQMNQYQPPSPQGYCPPQPQPMNQMPPQQYPPQMGQQNPYPQMPPQYPPQQYPQYQPRQGGYY